MNPQSTRRCSALRLIVPTVALIAVGPTAATLEQGPRVTPKTSHGAEQETHEVEPGHIIHARLSRGQLTRFQIDLASDQFLHVTIVPEGIALEIHVVDLRGQELRTVASPSASEGPLSLLLVIEASGKYTLQVQATDMGGLAGRFSLEIDPLRVATPDDRERSDAQALWAAVARLHKEGTADALKKALTECQRALALWRAAKDEQGEAETLLASGRILYDLGENPKALEILPPALQLFRSLSDGRGEAAVLNVLGEVEDAIGQEQDALAHYLEALRLRRAAGDRLAEAETLNNIGVVYDSLGEQRRALEYLEQSLALKHALQLAQREGTTLNNVGWALFTLGDMQAALERYRQALVLRRAERDLNGQAVTLRNIGSVYLTLGDPKTAMGYYAQAFQLAEQVQNRVQSGILTNNIGFAYFDTGDFQNALVYYKKSLEYRHAASDKNGEAVTLNNLAKVYGNLRDLAQENDYYARALALMRSVGDKRWEANILNNIGRSSLTRGEHAQASAHFRDALRLARATRDLRAEAIALYGLARVSAETGNLADARDRLEEALPIVESLRARVANSTLRASYFATLREPYDFYVDVLMQMHQGDASRNYDVEALEMLEHGRARSLLETLGESRTAVRSGVDPSLLDRERSLRELIESKRDVRIAILSRHHTEKEVAAVQRELDELVTQYGELQGEIRSKSPHYASLTQPESLSAASIQQLLDEDTVLLEFALGEPRSYGWAVTRETVTAAELPKRSQINETARRLYDLLTESNRKLAGETIVQERHRLERAEQDTPEAAAALSQMVLAPLAGVLNHKRLVIVSDGALHYVPFGVLPARYVLKDAAEADSRADPRRDVPLIVSHEIVRLPSASVLAVLRREATSRSPVPQTALVFADPVFERKDSRVRKAPNASPASFPKDDGRRSTPLPQGASDDWARERLLRSAETVGVASESMAFERLLFSRREAHAILAAMPAGTARAALDFEASRTTALSPALERYRIVHFATHALVNNERPELSGLVLSLVDRRGTPQNGFLALDDIYNLQLNADLVVLSACQTGLGKEIKGEGLVALARGFMHAGAPRVVASLWKVQDSASAELMQRFYAGMLQAGKRPAAALRDAQIEMLHEPRWSSPFYWAGFELQGEWR